MLLTELQRVWLTISAVLCWSAAHLHQFVVQLEVLFALTIPVCLHNLPLPHLKW